MHPAELAPRWAGRARFVLLDTDFACGQRFLAAWALWRQDAQRCGRLWVLAVLPQPLPRDALARAWGLGEAACLPAPPPAPALPAGMADEARMLGEALRAQWPPPTPDMQLLSFEAGRVRLLLLPGPAAQVLPQVLASVDAFHLPAPDAAGCWPVRALARLAAPGATLTSPGLDPALHAALRSAGFQLQPGSAPGPQPAGTNAWFQPRHTPPLPSGRQPQDGVQRVAVIGAGLAGAAVAAALAARGLEVQVFDGHPGAAMATSGNAGGLFHGVLHAQDGPHARWLRAAALHTARVLRPLLDSAAVAGRIDGMLRGERHLSAAQMQQLLDRLRLPADYLQVQPASALAGGAPAWLYPGGGWVAPASLCAAWLAQPGISLQGGQRVQRLQRSAGGWQLWGDGGPPAAAPRQAGASAGRLQTEVDAVVLCNADDALRLLPAPAGAAWPLQAVRGQTTVLPAGLPGLPALPQPLADAGYALQLADGRLLCGATSQPGDPDPALRHADHRHNLDTLRRLTGWTGEADPAQLQGRVGWRLLAADRLPLLGAVPDGAALDAAAGAGHRLPDQPRRVPRQQGLWIFTALGSRGITQAALGAELLASWLTGDPVPVPAALLDALDVARFASRAARRAAAVPR